MESSSLCAGISATIWPLQCAAEPFISAIVIPPSVFLGDVLQIRKTVTQEGHAFALAWLGTWDEFCPPGGQHRHNAGAIVTGVTPEARRGYPRLGRRADWAA